MKKKDTPPPKDQRTVSGNKTTVKRKQTAKKTTSHDRSKGKVSADGKKKAAPAVSPQKIQPIVPEEIKKLRNERKGIRMYFDANTQAAIIQYQNEPDPLRRSRIYVTDIMPAFDKLVENLINIHKFSGLHDTYDDLKHDCVSFLFETIRKYDSKRGTKAFSYFNVVAKNWLIVKTKQKTIKGRRTTSLDDPDALSNNEMKMVDEYCAVHAQDVLLENKTTALAILDLLYEIRSSIKTPNELSCVNAIITVFENIDELDILTKSAITLYIKELSGLSSKQLTTAMGAIRRYYADIRQGPDFDIF